ncbi:lysozyme inhibitor LprI family protein [Pseudomonas purpurea]|uniref:lysozyme inhibitor LprI family protein n=1 Tax=Pseudomonas purpurea TaxID=3136737 RepID=UPI0032664A53
MKPTRFMAPLTGTFLLLGLCGLAQAADDGYSPAYARCMSASGGVTADMLDCLGTELHVQDGRLNKGYKAAMALMEGGKKGQLQDVQRLWLKYRDAKCGFLIDLTGGTVDGLNQSSCALEMTKTRAEELESLAQP